MVARYRPASMAVTTSRSPSRSGTAPDTEIATRIPKTIPANLAHLFVILFASTKTRYRNARPTTADISAMTFIRVKVIQTPNLRNNVSTSDRHRDPTDVLGLLRAAFFHQSPRDHRIS